MKKKINFPPITILVGKNSAGKSTFARTFPLIRQSCEAKKRAPILWFGDRVDFGSYQKSIRRGSDKKDEIEFSFELSNIAWTPGKSTRAGLSQLRGKPFDAEIYLAIRAAGIHRSFASKIKIKCLGYEVVLGLSETNNLEFVTCDGIDWRPNITDYTEATYESMLPRVSVMREIERADKQPRYVEIAPFSDVILKFLGESEYASHETMFSLIAGAPLLQKGELTDYLSTRLKFADKEFHMMDPFIFVSFVSKIEGFVFGSKINELLDTIDNSLRSYYSGVKYIEPLRATAQRYYRKQELALDEIDSKGENLAMYLDNVGPWQLEEFNRWTRKNFGFTAKTINEGGHVAIVIQEDGVDGESNLADIGFGFSQILPVITQMWLSSRQKERGKRTSCIVIEQPELHLHPSFQAKLADVFAASVTGQKIVPHLLVETHSNHIINRLGQLINEGKLTNDDVQILIFEKEGNSNSSIRIAGFDENGYLKNWPAGFFEPEI
jgi:predicted ATPase